MSEFYNACAQAYLETHGFACEPEPAWITSGRKPDFYAKRADLSLWIEVKSLAETVAEVHHGRLFDYLRDRAKKLTINGSANAHFGPLATVREAKMALSLVPKAMQTARSLPDTRVMVVVPRDAASGEVTFSFRAQNGQRICILSIRSSTHSYSYPGIYDPEPFDQEVQVEDHVAGPRTACIYDLASPDDYEFLFELWPGDKPFRFLSVGNRDAGYVGNQDRIRNAVNGARAQIKNALKFREAPAIVFLYHDGPLVADENILLGAMFGNLTASFSRTHVEEAKLTFGTDGALRGQNSSISAVAYFRNAAQWKTPDTRECRLEATPVFVHNSRPSRPLAPGVFRGIEYLPEDSGKLRRVENI